MALAERTPYFQFLADYHRALCAHDAQFIKPAARAPSDGLQVNNLTEVNTRLALDELGQLLLCIVHTPTVEVSRLLVVIVEHLREDALVMSVAEAVRLRPYPLFGIGLHSKVGDSLSWCVADALEIGLWRIVPTILKLLHGAPAALGETGIADFVAIGQHLAVCTPDGLSHVAAGLHRDALIALTMVVGTHIEKRMVLTVVPFDEPVGDCRRLQCRSLCPDG